MSHDRDDAERDADIGAASSRMGEGMADTKNSEFLPNNRGEAAKGAGGLGGAAAGAAIGAIAGPVGAVVGALAGAVGGWWAGKGLTDASGSFDEKEDAFYRSHYEADPNRPADRPYEDVRPYYAIGHVAAHNPDYRSREFESVEQDLQKGWADHPDSRANWTRGRSYAQAAFARRTVTTQPGGAANVAAGTVATPGRLG